MSRGTFSETQSRASSSHSAVFSSAQPRARWLLTVAALAIPFAFATPGAPFAPRTAFPQSSGTVRPRPDFLRGVSFSREGRRAPGGGYASETAMEQLRTLRAMGVNAIALVPYGFLEHVEATSIRFRISEQRDQELALAARAARTLGMKVMLKPQLWVRGQFTGAIRFADEAQRTEWMRNYRDFILHYARLAEAERLDLFCIGTELGELTRHERDWRLLIADVRRSYRGPLTYAANWGAEFESLPFWDALDILGLNNYYPLRDDSADAADSENFAEKLHKGAAQLAEKIEAVHKKWKKPVLFTEIGYPSIRGGASKPWQESRTAEVSLEEQAAAYEAIFRAFAHRSWCRGMFWWKWPSDGRGGGPLDGSHTPLGKSAAEVLRDWYTRLEKNSKSAGTGGP